VDALVAFVGAILLASEGPPRLGAEDVERLGEQLARREPFLESAEAREEPGTLHRFFKKADYQVLRGNPVTGYWDAGGFHWKGNQIAWRGIGAAAPSAKKISQQAWEAAFRHVAEKRGVVVAAGAPVSIEGACVAAVVDPSEREPVPGVLLEVRLRGPGGVFRHRLAVGKATVEEAMGAALDFTLALARSAGP
jgi:hypothetical protein